MYCIEKSTCDVTLLGLFGALPQSFGAPIVIRRPRNCAPLVTLLSGCDEFKAKTVRIRLLGK